jgi:hypothetical protein
VKAPGCIGPVPDDACAQAEKPDGRSRALNPAENSAGGLPSPPQCISPTTRAADGTTGAVAAGRTPTRASTPSGQPNYVFVRASRLKRRPDDTLFLVPASQGQRASRRKLRAVVSDRQVHVKNMDARYPGGPIWPLQMRADMVAAYLDFVDTKDLCVAITSGEAPPPTTTRTKGKKVELIWHKEFVDRFISAKVSEAGSNLRRVHRGGVKAD